MMNNYEELKLMVVMLDQVDIITSSGNDNGAGGNDAWDQ